MFRLFDAATKDRMNAIRDSYCEGAGNDHLISGYGNNVSSLTATDVSPHLNISSGKTHTDKNKTVQTKNKESRFNTKQLTLKKVV